MKTIVYHDQSQHSSYDPPQLLGQTINVSLAMFQDLGSRRNRPGSCLQEVYKLVGGQINQTMHKVIRKCRVEM